METANQWVIEYGCAVLFGLLALGDVGAPIPDETLLVLTGAMVARGQLHAAAVLAAALGGRGSYRACRRQESERTPEWASVPLTS